MTRFLLVLTLFATTPVFSQSLPHSFARPDEAAIRHLALDLNVDFQSKVLTGTALLEINRRPDTKQLWLETRGLTISEVTTADGAKNREWKLGDDKGSMGQSLAITLPPGIEAVKIEYSTSPGAEALQWLTPEQTTDKEKPFLFTQSQAILARTWVPCQDTPAVRMTYSAKVKVPSDLMAVMSASNPQAKNSTGEYSFEMKQPIPSYLLALAIGDLQFQKVGARSGVYAEPSVLKKAAWELEDTERMIEEAEKLYGPYRWDRYDVIFLPASFPFGGMENPRLTFATPTILAGDRSLVALIAHELAHSWSGNLVTNATWNDFWLNEGFTVYFEQRIMEAVYSREYSEMLARLSLEGLKEELKSLQLRDTWLKLDLAGRNPDDGMTAIAYDKGYFFLRAMEENVGREKWDAFLKDYFTKHAFKSMTTEKFLAYLNENLSHEFNTKEWVYGPGLPANCPEVKTEALVQVAKDAAAFLNGTKPEDLATAKYTTHHWLHFLRSLKGPLSDEQMTALDQAFKFTNSGNAEITHDWMIHVIASSYGPGIPRLEEFLTQQGRRKFLTPLYKKLLEVEGGHELASAIYKKARPMYHAVSRETIDKLLEWK
ncbi:MAG: M1 family metallopeptidase [Planctomycetaceae bacterium]